jgi:hypothetical protein
MKADMHDSQQALPAVLLSPRGPYRVGDAVSASWSMTNAADRDLADVRFMLDVPASLDPILESSSIYGLRGDALAAAFTPAGLALGTIPRGESVNAVFDLRFGGDGGPPHAISASLRVAGAIFVSEPVEIVLRARALLEIEGRPQTCELDPPSGKLGVAFRLHNVGELGAERVDVLVPAMAGLAFSGVYLTDDVAAEAGKEPFRLPDIPRGGSLDVVLEFEKRGFDLGSHVELDGVRIAYEGGTLLLDPITIALDGPGRALSGTLATASSAIEPGSVVRLDLAIANAFHADACGVLASFELPPQLVYCSGTISVDGWSDLRRNDPRAIPVGTVAGRSRTLVSLYATVVAPLSHDSVVTVGASIDGERVSPLELTVESKPFFPSSPHAFELDGPPVVGAGESRTVRVRAANAGTADAAGVRVRLISPHLVVERAVVVLSSGAREDIVMKPSVSRDGVACAAADLGTVAARDVKTLEVEVRAPDHFSDDDRFTLRADLRFADTAEFEIGEISLAGRCRPSIDAAQSGLTSLRNDPLRVGQVRSYTLRVKNAGLAAARGVVVSLNLPGMLAIEAVNGEPATTDLVTIREIPAGGAVEVPIALRLLESVDGGASLTIAPVVSGESISTTQLQPLHVAAAGQAFLDEFVTRIDARDSRLLATLSFRNVGDAVAYHVVVEAVDLPGAYVPDSLRLGGIALPDAGGTSPLVRGFTLPPLAPGSEVTLAYEMTEAKASGARVAFMIRSRSQDEILPEAAIYPGTSQRVEPAQAAQPARAPEFARAAAPVEVETFARSAPERRDVPRFVEDFVPAKASNGKVSTNGNGSNGHGHGPLIVETRAAASAPTGSAETTLLARTTATADRAYGLVGYLVMDREETQRIRRVSEAALAIPALGTYRHFFAMRALVPKALLGASAAVAAEWQLVHERACLDMRGPFLRAAMPAFDPSAEWAGTFDDVSSGEAASRAIAAIRQAGRENVGYDDLPVPNDHIRGAIGNEFESYLSTVSEPSGNVLNLILAEALPTESPRDPHLSKVLKRYRERLKLLFAALLYQNPSARHERMLSGLDVELDDTLRAIAARLRDPRWA